jgi:hypothetical protein
MQLWLRPLVSLVLPLVAADTPVPKPPAAAKPATTQQRLGATGQRNENVVVWLIDTNAVKESNIRVGTMPTAVIEANPESQYFAAEHGRPASEVLMMRPAAGIAGWHGDAFWWHQNSIFNARTFFQVGGVKPSHRNHYGGRVTGLIPKVGALTAAFSQRDIRGMVNGNVLVPLAGERTPLATDPATRDMVQKFLNAYPKDLPNRLDFDQRALNTNAPQRIGDISGSLRLESNTSSKGRLILFQSLDRQRIDAFQLVAGQNPDTEIHNLRSRIVWQYALAPATQIQLGASFSRNRSALTSEPNAVGPRVRLGYQIEELGPDSSFPINRATNTFRYGAAVQHQAGAGRHQVSAGGDVIRFQLNGIESSNARGQFQFGNNFGRTAIENLRWGTPSMYEGSVGDLNRGYRNWMVNGYVADRWKLNPRLQVILGLRYMMDTRPDEVHGKEQLPYGADGNNFSPRVAVALQAGRGWVVRAMYTTTFAQILPVTYQQIRYNPPNVYYLMAPDPNLVDPLGGITIGPNTRYSPTWISKDLATPYSHQYNAGLEHKLFAGSILRVNYIGSRSFKLLNNFTMNRAEPVPGIPLTTATVDRRRADSQYSDTKTIVNAGIAYYDAGQALWDLPLRRGVLFSMGYTFSKAIDEGPDFTATAANKDVTSSRSQWQGSSLKDRKGLSNFDSTHALVFHYAWEPPGLRNGPAWLRAATTQWQISGANMWKKGTPLTLFVGSDAPGFGNVDGGPGDRPNLLDPSILGATVGHPDESLSILRRDRFAFVKLGEHAGNLGRGTLRKASIWNWNAAVSRQFRLPNEMSVQLRAEAFNLSNTPQFDEPQRNLSALPFGKITNTLNDGRIFQAGFRLLF